MYGTVLEVVFASGSSYLDNTGINAISTQRKSPVSISFQPISTGGCFGDSIRDMLIPPRTEHQEGSHSHVCR